MTTVEEMDALVEATFDPTLPPTELLVLQQKLAAHRYYFASTVSQLSRKANQAEVDRKAIYIRAKLEAKAESMGGKPLSEAAAADKAEQRPEVIRARAAEIMDQADYEQAKMKMQASADLVMSLTMRISYLRDEAKNTKSISTH